MFGLDLGNISDKTTWLGNSLNITFNATNSCAHYDLLRGHEDVGEPSAITPEGEVERVTFTINNITMAYDNATMSVNALEKGTSELVHSNFFTIHVQGEDDTFMYTLGMLHIGIAMHCVYHCSLLN